uniref:Uncharacterized protein n=1 Tax=Anguilla anguilla TaxID=7936 RepID=A0A0E9UZ51_ANGAN
MLVDACMFHGLFMLEILYVCRVSVGFLQGLSPHA